MTTTTTVPAAVAATLLELSAAAYAAREARPMTAAGMAVAVAASDRLEHAAAAVHRAHFPRRRGRVVVAGGGVYLQAPGGRVTTVHAAPGGDLEAARLELEGDAARGGAAGVGGVGGVGELEGDHLEGGWTSPVETDIPDDFGNGHTGHPRNGAKRTSGISDTRPSSTKHHRPDTLRTTPTDTRGDTMPTAPAPSIDREDELADTKPYEKVTRHTRQPRGLWRDACRKANGQHRRMAEVITDLLQRYVRGDFD